MLTSFPFLFNSSLSALILTDEVLTPDLSYSHSEVL